MSFQISPSFGWKVFLVHWKKKTLFETLFIIAIVCVVGPKNTFSLKYFCFDTHLSFYLRLTKLVHWIELADWDSIFALNYLLSVVCIHLHIHLHTDSNNIFILFEGKHWTSHKIFALSHVYCFLFVCVLILNFNFVIYTRSTFFSVLNFQNNFFFRSTLKTQWLFVTRFEAIA